MRTPAKGVYRISVPRVRIPLFPPFNVGTLKIRFRKLSYYLRIRKEGSAKLNSIAMNKSN